MKIFSLISSVLAKEDVNSEPVFSAITFHEFQIKLIHPRVIEL